MKKKRLIPVLLLRNGWLVQSKGFSQYQNLGNPITATQRLSQWASDELIFLDISQNDEYDLRRDDLNTPNRHNILEILEDVAKATFMPFTFGGKIRTLNDIEDRLKRGADKISINTIALENPDFITLAAKEFGSQCIVLSMDVKLIDSKYKIMKHGNKYQTEYDPIYWAQKVESLGAGEIFLNSIDRDGMKTGYDIELITKVSENVKIPVIACGGVGNWEHFSQALRETKADAVAASNIFHYIDQSVYLAKKYLFDQKLPVRQPSIIQL